MIGDLINVPTSPVILGSVTVSATASENPETGDLWGDTVSRTWKEWDGTAWVVWGALQQTPGSYGHFISTVDQTNSAAVNTVTLNTAVAADGITVVDGTKVTFAVAGQYRLDVAGQLATVSVGAHAVDVWIDLNGSVVPNSGTTVNVDGSARWELSTVVTVAAGGYARVQWYSSDAAMLLDNTAARSNPTRPAIPSISLLATKLVYNTVSIAP